MAIQNSQNLPKNDKIVLYIFLFFSSQDEVKKNLTIKRDKKKELAQRKLLEQERAATAALVEKHSQEMMLLITEKRANYLETEANGDLQHITSDYPSQPPPPGPPAFAKIGNLNRNAFSNHQVALWSIFRNLPSALMAI